MRQRRPIPNLAAAAIVGLKVVLVLAGCEITQEHIDQASEKLAEATVADGSPPTATQIAAAVPLRREHLAGSSWRLIELQRMSGMPNSSGWPHAMAVISLGSNGKIVWHMMVHPELERDRGHWGVTNTRDHQFYFAWAEGVGNIKNSYAGRTVDTNTVCLGGTSTCDGVLQRVTP